MSNTDCNSSIASSTTTTSYGSKSKKRLSGIKKFKSKLMRRSKSGGSDSGYPRGGSEFDSPQDYLPVVEDVNVSMETVVDDKIPASTPVASRSAGYANDEDFANNYSEKSEDGYYCPYKTTKQNSSPNSASVEEYINNQMDVAPYSPGRKSSPSGASPPLSCADGTGMKFSSACGPSPAKLKLLDLSLDNSDDGIYEEDSGGNDQDELSDQSEADKIHVDEKKCDEVNTSNVSFINVLPRVAVIKNTAMHHSPQRQSSAAAANESMDKEETMSWKNVGRKESIDSKQTTDDDDTSLDGWKNVGADMDDSSSIRSSSVDLGDGTNNLRSNSVDLTAKHPSDGFLDEYPVIVDEGKEGDGKSVRFEESQGVPAAALGSCDMPLNTPVAQRQSESDMLSPPTTVSGTDCMAQFSSVTGPSPVKLKSPHSRDYFNFDLSMETSMESSAAEFLDQSNIESVDESTGSDDNLNVWNGNGIDIAIDEATEDSTVNESCTDTDAAIDESVSLQEGYTSASASRSDLMSPLTVDGTMQQETSQQSILAPTRSLRQGKKLQRDIPTTTSMLHLEYNVDHSCSTPLERLARDIGNILRQWNVHNGCDRHVPLDWLDRMEDETSEDQESSDDEQNELDQSIDTERIEKAVEVEMAAESNQIMSMDLCMNRFASRSRKINEWMGEDAAKLPSGIDIAVDEGPTTPKSSPRKQKQQSDHKPKSTSQLRSKANHSSGSRCIRSKKVVFETIGFTPSQNDISVDESGLSRVWARRRYSIPLVLSLWDAPSIPTEIKSEDQLCALPLSLRPDASYSSHALLGELGVISPCGTKRVFYDQSLTSKPESSQNVAFGRSAPPLDTGFGRDISSLFNIGQHITLSLDMETAQNSARYNQDNNHLQDIQALYNDVHAYLADTIEQALEQKAVAAQERQRRLKRYRKRALRSRDFNSTQQTNKHGDLVPVASQSMSMDVEGEDGHEQITFFDQPDKENSDIRYHGNAHEEETSSDDETMMMSLDDELRLNEAELHSEAMSILTSMVQNALNLAASENECHIPVFGLWGSYHGASKEKDNSVGAVFADIESATSSWIPSRLILADHQHQQSQHTASEGDEAHKNLLLSSPVVTGHCYQDSFRSTHRVYSIPRQTLPMHLSTLHGLSCVLLAQCPPQADTSRVMVTSARHCYHMDVKKETKSEQSWRMVSFMAPRRESTSPVEVYRETCLRQASFLLERASSPWIYKPVPMWGPSEGNPLQSLSASVSWGVVSNNDSCNEGPESLFSPSKTPASVALLQLPLKIRSSNFVPTSNELLDMEYSLQSAAFDPLGMGVESKNGDVHFGPREPIFFASARFDSNLPCATLSANVRCVFAALLRCGSLGPDALPGHLTRKKILSKLGGPVDVSMDDETNEVITTMAESESMLRSSLKLVGPVTNRLVEAMDWAEVGTISKNADIDRGIADALQRIGAGGLYPAPPEEIFAKDLSQNTDYNDFNSPSQSKGSQPGRLLSILFAHMARLRTPPAMMSLWLAFVEELRSRWDRNESLPNLGFVPGLDENGTDNHQGHIHSLSSTDCRVLGHRAHLAAFVNSSEPDPDRNQCIINQKLQVFNICIESKMSLEALQEALDEESMEDNSSYTNSDNDEFFEAEEEEVDFESDPGETSSKRIEAMLKLEAAAVANSGHNRVGARCPVPGCLPLIETGDQVYAPYLQRTLPMTDEEEEKQNKLFGKGGDSNNERLSIRDRIEVSQRIQTPKLMSDMSAFKAANPGCIFEDFVTWYGNPQNPLSEEVNGESVRHAHERRSNLSPKEAKVLALEEASEAIAILMSLRSFWEDSFEDAEPQPAAEQQPLFDPYSTVEMVLHSFETIHPSLLMGQALAVNLTNAEFVLETAAKPVICVHSVEQSLLRVKTAVRAAVGMLTRDASEGCLHVSTQYRSDEYTLVHVSSLTIQECEEACNAIGEIELLLSRALALWQLCPDAELVNSLLQCQDGSFIFLKSPKERGAFLNAIKQQQSTKFGVRAENHFPEASMREYVIRNGDQDTPCQLNARLVSDMNGGHSALIALTKSSRD